MRQKIQRVDQQVLQMMGGLTPMLVDRATFRTTPFQIWAELPQVILTQYPPRHHYHRTDPQQLDLATWRIISPPTEINPAGGLYPPPRPLKVNTVSLKSNTRHLSGRPRFKPLSKLGQDQRYPQLILNKTCHHLVNRPSRLKKQSVSWTFRPLETPIHCLKSILSIPPASQRLTHLYPHGVNPVPAQLEAVRWVCKI